MPWSGPEPCPPRLQGPVAGRLFVLEPVAWISHLSPGRLTRWGVGNIIPLRMYSGRDFNTFDNTKSLEIT